MARYLKSFMEANITDQFLSELQDFCEMNLVYLMDDGLQVSVTKHPINREDMGNSHLCFVRLNYSVTNQASMDDVDLLVHKNWNDIKDVIIPFFTRLDRNYNVITFGQLPMVTSSLFGQGINNTSGVQFGLRRRVLVNPALSNGGFRKNFTVDDVISDRLDLGNNLIVEIRFYVSCNDEVIVPVKKTIGSRVKKFLGFNESDFYVRLKGDDLQDQLDDICEQFLAPLSDDGFTYEIRPAWNGEFDIRLSFTDGGRTNKLFDYTLVMDRFIPLVRVLSRRFELAQLVYFYSTEEFDTSKKVFTVDQICADKGPDYLVTTVKLTVKGTKD